MLAMWAVTGLYFAFPSQFRAAVNAVSPITGGPGAAVACGSGRVSPNVARPDRRAQQRAPGQYVARVVVPSTGAPRFS